MSKSSEDVFVHHQFRHIRQIHSWDCGLTCVAMVFGGIESKSKKHSSMAFRNHEFYNAISQLQNDPVSGFGKRPWTMDLCNILRTLQVDYDLFTRYATANVHLSKLSYYSRTFAKDSARITNLLQSTNLNKNVIIGSISNQEFISKLRKGPLIVLTNVNELHCKICSKFKWISKWRSFTGHYVLVVGFDRNNSTIFYMDPGVAHEMCLAKLKTFTKARLSQGTDEDVIAIKL